MFKIPKNIAQKICTILFKKLLTFAKGCGIVLSRKGKQPTKSRWVRGFPESLKQQAFRVEYPAERFGKEGESDVRYHRAAVFQRNVQQRLVYTAGLLRKI